MPQELKVGRFSGGRFGEPQRDLTLQDVPQPAAPAPAASTEVRAPRAPYFCLSHLPAGAI